MSKSLRENLQDIITSTKLHYDLGKSSSRLPTAHRGEPAGDIDIPPLSLGSITAQFQRKLLQNGLIPKVCQIVLQQASEIATIYQESYSKSCRYLMLDSPTARNGPPDRQIIDKIRGIFEHWYEHKDLESFLSRALVAQKNLQECSAGRSQRERKPFNHEYTPYLDAYFQQNAFPSAADRKSLAQNGNMSPRQIEVWFQNHRNRAKKDGQSLKRLAHGATVNLSLDILAPMVSSFTGNISVDGNTVDDSSSDDEENNEDEVQILQSAALFPPAPRDVIPQDYLPRSIQPCTTDCKAFGLPSPSRTRSTTASQTRPSTSISELIEMFSAKLNLREGASRKTPKRSQSPVLESWVSATTTVPCPAPHPAMIRRLSSFFTGISSPGPRAQPTTLIPTKVPSLPSVLPTWELSPPPRRRKPAQLPRRSPPYARPCASQSPSQHSTLSRMSSISSISSVSSSDSRSTSSSSSTSTSSTSTSEFTAESSPELTTPPVSPTPDGTQTFDADQDDDIFGDRYYESYSRTQGVYDEQAFSKDVSMSIPQFAAMNMPEFHFFES